MDAALLCSLDYFSDKLKAEKRVRNLEAQIALYDANMRRMREENLRLKARLGADDADGEAEAKDEAEAAGKAETAEKAEAKAETEAEAAEKAETAKEAEAESAAEEKAENEASGDESRQIKLRQIESLLRK
jgi:peptidoglycan hydrolase CwlO-like protein